MVTKKNLFSIDRNYKLAEEVLVYSEKNVSIRFWLLHIWKDYYSSEYVESCKINFQCFLNESILSRIREEYFSIYIYFCS